MEGSIYARSRARPHLVLRLFVVITRLRITGAHGGSYGGGGYGGGGYGGGSYGGGGYGGPVVVVWVLKVVVVGVVVVIHMMD